MNPETVNGGALDDQYRTALADEELLAAEYHPHVRRPAPARPAAGVESTMIDPRPRYARRGLAYPPCPPGMLREVHDAS